MSLTQPRPDLSPAPPAITAITAQTLLQRKQAAQPITALTAYDYPTARLVDAAGIDLILVGDSLAMAVLGHPDTLSVTLDEMLHHTRAVRRGTRSALLLADMPFGTYHLSPGRTVRNALRFLQEAGAAAVKLEGPRAPLVRRLTQEQIPVVGHLGLTPQSVHAMGGYKVQGRTAQAAEKLLHDALALEDAGAIALVLEGIPREVAALVTQSLQIPTIGIGAGPDCDGQILVFHDLFQLSFTAQPKFVRPAASAATLITQGLETFRESVLNRTFPNDHESYHLPPEAAAELFSRPHEQGAPSSRS